jgi:hypothetical protein
MLFPSFLAGGRSNAILCESDRMRSYGNPIECVPMRNWIRNTGIWFAPIILRPNIPMF